MPTPLGVGCSYLLSRFLDESQSQISYSSHAFKNYFLTFSGNCKGIFLIIYLKNKKKGMKNLSIFKKIIIVFISVGLITIIADSLIADYIFRKTISENADKQFFIDLKKKKTGIENYLNETKKKIKTESKFYAVQDLFKILENYHKETGINKNESYPVEAEKYRTLTKKYHDYFSEYIKENYYYDVFFICAEHGHVMYSVAQENDFGTNLSVGKYKDTHLAKLWKEVVSKKETIITDYQPYAPSGGQQALFVGTPILANGKMIGVLAVQISTKKTNKIVTDTDKLYQSSETYIVGKSEDGKFRLKSDRTVKKGKIGDEKSDFITNLCINKKEIGKKTKKGSLGILEYDYYMPLKIKGLQWGLFITVSIDEVLEPVKLQTRIILIVSIISILIIIISAYLLSKSISEPIKKVVNAMKKISKKQIDFQITEKRNDEIGELYSSINEINTNFREIIININDTATAVSDASNQLSSASQDISSRANEQASTTEEVATSMEEILAMINSNSQNAEITGQTSTKSANEMKQSNVIFVQTIKSVSEISKKISIITEIANKTDILSINASIEAARAGEAGEGFAVVAYEIRKLADKTKIASDEINKLSKKGQKISKIAGKKLKNAIPEIIKSAELVNNIVSAGKEQQSGVENINISVQQLTEITNENSASAEEMSSSAEELSAQAEQLKELISVFTIGNLQNKNMIIKQENKQEVTEHKNKGFNMILSNKDNSDDDFETF